MSSRLVSLSIAGLLALPACGGAVASTPANPSLDGGASSDSGAPPDSGVSPDTGTGTPPADGGASSCPSAQPAAGGGCSGAVVCEYGSDPDVDCDTLMACSSGAWVETQAGEACSTASSPVCPATFAELGSLGENMCSLGTTCVYPEARCSCQTNCEIEGFENPDGGVGTGWCCPDSPAGGTQCPSPRPRIGTPCDTAVECDYGGCNGNVMLECDGGVWEVTTMFGCPG